jgi:hypothetical protein
MSRYSKATIYNGNSVSIMRQSERLEIMGCRQRVDMVIEMAETLINKYSLDDPSQLVSDVKRISEHWQDLMSRLVFGWPVILLLANNRHVELLVLFSKLVWLAKMHVVCMML